MNIDTKGHNKIVKANLILIISVIVCSASIIGGELEYAGNDDTFRNLMAVGAFGDKYNYYIPFSNVLYGVPIYLLNSLIPQVNWYYWVMIGLDVFAISGLCYVLVSRLRMPYIALFTTIVNLIFARDYYIVVQFTKTGYLWTIVGVAFVLYAVNRKGNGWIIGLFLLLCGIASRSDCLMMTLPFAVCYVLSSILLQKSKIDKEGMKKITSRVSICIVTVILLFTSEFVFRKANPEWEAFWKYNAASVYLRDHMNISYEHDVASYDEINTDDNDIALYNSWLFGDTDFYTLGWLYDVTNIERNHNDVGLRFNTKVVAETTRNLLDVFIHAPIGSWGVIVLAVALCIILLLKRGWQSKILGLCYLGGLWLIYWYFTCVNRFMWRAECGVFVAIIVFGALHLRNAIGAKEREASISEKSIADKKWIAMACGIVAIILIGGYSIKMGYQWRYDKDKHIVANEADISGRLYSFLENEDNTYMLTDFYVTNNPEGLTRAKWSGIYKNSVYLGNWVIPSPTGLYYAKERGMDNPMTALVEADNAYLYCRDYNKASAIQSHLSKIFEKQVSVEQISDELWLYRIE